MNKKITELSQTFTSFDEDEFILLSRTRNKMFKTSVSKLYNDLFTIQSSESYEEVKNAEENILK